MTVYFPKLKSLGINVIVVEIMWDFSNYATKADLKNAAGVETSKFAKKVALDHLKSDAGKLDIDKLKNVRTNLSNLKSKVDKLNVYKSVYVPVVV